MSEPTRCATAIVESVLRDLDRASGGEDVARNLLSAMEQIFLHSGQLYRDRISQQSRHKLNVASVSARTTADQILPANFPRSTLNAGMGALAYQVMFWAERPSVTMNRSIEHVLRVHDDAFLLRNELKKLSVSEGAVHGSGS